jgi:hypothetical protein
MCSGLCRSLDTDPNACGNCSTACASGHICQGGTCVVTCGLGQTNCAGSCRDLTTDNNNCGTCGHACPSGQICSAASCN